MNILLAIVFSILPVIIILSLIYNVEEVKKQPFWMIAILFIGGILSWVLVRYISNLLGNDIYKSQVEVYSYVGDLGFFLVSFGIIAVIEEICKFLIISICSIRNKNFTNPYDGIMYATCISLGFAFVENIMYIMNYGMSVAISRAIFSIPVHASFGIMMGYYFGLGKMCEKDMVNDKLKMYYLSFFIPFLFHGLYDYLCNIKIPYINIILIIYVLLMYGFSIYLLVKLYKVDMKKIRRTKEQVLVYHPPKNNYKNMYYENTMPKQDIRNNNMKESNWKHSENNETVYEDNVVTMDMFKKND